MSNESKSNRPRSMEDIDKFWELDDLLPQKRANPINRSLNTDTVEIDLPSSADTTSAPSRFGGSPIPARKSDSPAYQGYGSLRDTGGTATPAAHSAPTAPAASPITSPRDEARRLREIPMKIKAGQTDLRMSEPYLVYTPDSTIIKRVSLTKWQTRFDFYNKFRTDAHRLWERSGTKCEPVSYFSYIPQYNQLTYAQMKWYLYWRDQVRAKVYPRTDYSYILLHIYEILNCPDLINPALGVELLCDIWLAYRTQHPRIDNYLCEWLCDYCLINRLPCPTKRLEPILQAVVTSATFKEFYMDSGDFVSSAANVLSFSTNYDWRTGRYVTNENRQLFATHIGRAFERVYDRILSRDDSKATASSATIVRDAYNGGLCVWDMKRSITVEYISYTRSQKFKLVVTDIIKYCENCVRMALGIKARLKVENITDEIKACIDEYFAENLPYKKASKKKAVPEQIPNEYEKLYEPLSSSLDVNRAMEIEKKSWSTTEILTSSLVDEESKNDFAESDSVSEPSEQIESIPDESAVSEALVTAHYNQPHINEAEIPVDNEFASLVSALDENLRSAIKSILDGNNNVLTSLAAELGVLKEALADKINEIAYDIIGDSLIEPCDGGYRIIPDYLDELSAVLH